MLANGMHWTSNSITCPRSSHGTETRKGHWSCENPNNSYLVSKTVWDTLLTKREHLPTYLLCSSFYHFNSAFSRTNIIDYQTHNDNYRWETTRPQSSHGTETRKGHWSCENPNNSYLVSKTVWDTLLTKREHLPTYLLCSSFYHFNSAFSRTNIIDCQTHNDNYRWETTCPQSSRGTETGKGHRSSENPINSYLVLKTVCNTLHTKREHSQKYLLCSSFYCSNSVFFFRTNTIDCQTHNDNFRWDIQVVSIICKRRCELQGPIWRRSCGVTLTRYRALSRFEGNSSIPPSFSSDWLRSSNVNYYSIDLTSIIVLIAEADSLGGILPCNWYSASCIRQFCETTSSILTWFPELEYDMAHKIILWEWWSLNFLAIYIDIRHAPSVKSTFNRIYYPLSNINYNYED